MGKCQRKSLTLKLVSFSSSFFFFFKDLQTKLLKINNIDMARTSVTPLTAMVD